MPFGVMGRVGYKMCSVGGGADRPTERGNFGCRHEAAITNGEFVAIVLQDVAQELMHSRLACR